MRAGSRFLFVLLTNIVAWPLAANPALQSCSQFQRGRIHVAPWTATLVNGKMSAPLPDREHNFFYVSFRVAEADIETSWSPEKLSVVVPRDITQLSYEYRLYLFGRAEHA